MKKSVFIFLLLFISLLSISFISAEVTSCNIVSDGCSASHGTLMKLSSYTNGHGSLASASNSYQFYLCCNGLDVTGTTCTGSNTVLRLSSSSNAHAQIRSYSSYDYDVCYEDLSCTYSTSTSCPTEYPIETVSISSLTNAHIANFDYYSYKICCNSEPPGGTAVCGNSLIETGEECDDGNTNNYDGCSYDECQEEAGYTCYQPIANGPSCCYSDNPNTFWLDSSENVMPSGSTTSISENSVLGLVVYEDFCLAPGTQRTILIYKDRALLSDILIKSITAQSVGGSYFSGSWVVSASDIAALGDGTSTVYFVLSEPTTGSTVQSYEVDVDVSFVCGNGIVEGTEDCDDGNTEYNDGCAASCTIENGWTCLPGNPSVCQKCGNGIKEGTEGCDDGNTVSGDGCSSTCTIEDLCSGVSCPSGQSCDPNTGECVDDNETCASLGYECGTVNGESCGSCGAGQQCDEGQCVDIPSCSIDYAFWTDSQVTEGTIADLNVGISDCDGLVMTFEIKEDDGGFNPDDDVLVNPSSQVISSGATSVSATWTAEYQSDVDGLQTDPPEYYFTAYINSEGLSLRSNNDMEVLEQNVAQCLGIASCADYTEAECGVLSCSSTHYSEINYYENSEGDRCSEISDWGCVWDSGSDVCNANQEITTQCGTCGNYIIDYDEECDDGNAVSGDGCSDSCQFEGLTAPCPEGTTLCSDGTCSIECRDTDTGPSSCDYDSICDSNEGCTCIDCDDEMDSCVSGTVCKIEDSFCCDPQSDGVCNPYCSFSDPDCGVSTCGNGFRESGEQCDDGNTIPGDGCSAVCTYEIIGPGELCPEGTALCSDGTCSLNCFYTDEGYASNVSDGCEAGLTYSLIDNACCNSNSDSICNPYCSFSDPDCDSDPFTSVGNCGYIDNSQDDCEDGILERNLTAVWTGESEQPASCDDIVDRLVCPAKIEVSFFSMLQFVLAVVLIILIYFLIRSKIDAKKRSKKKSSSRRKK